MNFSSIGFRFVMPILFATILATAWCGLANGKSNDTSSLLLADAEISRAVIVVPEGKLTASEYIAQRDLAIYLQKITGATYTVVTENNLQDLPNASKNDARIYIGRTADRHLDLDTESWPKDKWLIRTQDNALHLTGGRWFGVEYAVNHFLSDVLGVRWWTPWDETVPTKHTLRLEKLNMQGTPAFSHSRRHDAWNQFARYSFNARNGATRDIFVDADDTFSWNGGPFGTNTHNMPNLISWDKYGESHPEWFARDTDGQIFNVSTRKPVGHCFTNENLRLEIEKKIRARIEQRVQQSEDRQFIFTVPFDYHVSAGDHAPACRCEHCGPLSKAEGSDAAPLILMLNKMAKTIRADYPWVTLSTIAYEITRNPPKSIRADEGVHVRVATEQMDISKPFTLDANQAAWQDVAGWSQRARELGIWSYEIDFAPHRVFGGYGITWGMPIPNIQHMAERFRTWRDMGVVSIYQQSLGNDFQTDMAPLRSWMTCKLMEDPDRDWQTLEREFLNGYYGSASSFIHEYLDALRQSAKRHPSRITFYAGLNQYDYLNVDSIIKANHVFDRAEQAVVDDAVLSQRVRHARIGTDRAIMLLWPKLNEQWVRSGRALKDMPLNRDQAMQRYAMTFREQLARIDLPKSEHFSNYYQEQFERTQTQWQSYVDRTLKAAAQNAYIPLALPEQFRKTKAHDYPVGEIFFKFEPSDTLQLVDDTNADGGKAIQWTLSASDFPLIIENFEGKQLLSLSADDIAGPGYHWYNVGQSTFDYTQFLRVFSDNPVSVYALEAGNHDVWLSLKFERLKSNKDAVAVSLQRMILLEMD